MDSTTYAVRRAQCDELVRLQEIERAAANLFKQTKYEFLADAEPNPLEFLLSQQVSGMVWVVTDFEDQPVGFAVACLIDGSVHLHEIDVDPVHARKGLGTRLVREVIAWARGGGHRQLTLSTFRDVAWNAPYYRKLGFEDFNDHELSPGLVGLRVRERELGLPVDERVCMRLIL